MLEEVIPLFLKLVGQTACERHETIGNEGRVDALCHVQAGGPLSLESLGELKADVYFRWACHRAIAYFARVCLPSITSFSGSSPVAISNL